MNWKLILSLSLAGLVMGLAAVFVIPTNVEPMFWGPLMIGSALAIARFAPRRHFLHGFATSLANCVWITGSQIVFADTYLARHPEEAAMLSRVSDSARVAMAATGPLFGVAFGIVLGLLAFGASRIVKSTPRVAAT